MGVSGGSSVGYPGTKPKAVSKRAHSDMMLRRLDGEGGENKAINQLKAKIGSLNGEISRLYKLLYGKGAVPTPEAEVTDKGESDNKSSERHSARLPESKNHQKWDLHPDGANETVISD